MKKITETVYIFLLSFVLTFIHLTREIYIEIHFIQSFLILKFSIWYTYFCEHALIWRDRKVSIKASKLASLVKALL